MIRATLPLVLLLTACGPADGDATDDGLPPPDPDVQTYLPADYVPDAPTRLVFLGDSITAGYGATETDLTYTALLQKNNKRKWPDFAGVDLKTTEPTIKDVIDVSVGGATTYTLLSSQIAALSAELGNTPAAGSTVIVLTIGGNDAQRALLPGGEPADIIDQALVNMADIVDELRALFVDDPWIYATNIYEPTDGVGQASECFFGFDLSAQLPELERYNSEFAELGADMGFAAVDLRGHFLGHGFRYNEADSPNYDADDPKLWLADDCIHPNNRGHHEIRRLFHAAISGEPLRLSEAPVAE